MKIIDRAFDPIFVVAHDADRIELRIGESKPGESRIAMLSTREARLLAFSLLGEVEKAASISN